MNTKYLILLFFFLPQILFAQFGKKDLVKIDSYQSFDKVYPGSELKLAVKVNIDSSWHINSHKPYDEFLIPTELVINNNDFKISNTVYPEPHDIKLGFSDEPLSVWEGEFIIGSLIETSENLQPGKNPVVVTLNYQACNNSTCLPPASVQDTIEVEVADRKAVINEINQEIFKDIDLSYSSLSSNEKTDTISSTLEGSGLFLGLIIVFLGGLALNLTPCVYPLIPITIGYFGGQTEGNTKKLFMMGLLFLVGMSITYSVIGVITSLTGAVFGALLQNTLVIIFIALIFIVLSLSMFGVYEFKLPDSLVAKAGGAKGGMFGALFMGLTMGIVAAPCIGPFVLGLVAYVAAKGDPFLGFIMFFVLSVGLGLPYLFLAVFSGKIKKLPRAGDWMEAVKHIFGFILLGMAVYFLLPVLPEPISGYILPVFMIIAALYLLFFDKLANNIKAFRVFKIVFSLILIIIAAYALIPSDKNSIAWEKYSGDLNMTEINKPVIIDFYADWCIPCKELDALTFSDPGVIETSKNFVTLKADMTKTLSEDVENLRNRYNIIGVPTVLVLNERGDEVRRITGFIGADEFHEILKNVN